ncbi:hypothetical protein MAM1_0050c03332 [Mucor ambiguus]|uniref:Uncharacterized protein n=1 Tax=Mucor ambiguus TaxID=91626 RepID=A0A0C9M430_9FUNG|nr:hypothetical protein MAM1_0050c03332 [Mucor ambiguus]
MSLLLSSNKKSRVSTIQSTVAIDATVKALVHVNMPLNIATNVSFEDENKGYNADSKANDNGTSNAVETKAINGHVEQEATTAKYCKIWIHLIPNFSH